MKHWNLGNTTVRNPNRIRDGLKVFKRHFEGKPFTEKEHLEFFNKLLSEKIIESDKSYKSSKEISGRKWAACFNKLGLASAWKSKGSVKITDAGNALLSNEVIQEDIFLRQFLKYHLPSKIEHGKKFEGFDVNPFYVTLCLLRDLRTVGISGLTKEEIGLYVITCIKNQDIDEHKQKIIEYRQKRDLIKGKQKKKEFYHENKVKLIFNLYKSEIKQREKIIQELYDAYLKNHNIFSHDDVLDKLKKVVSGGKGSNTRKSLSLQIKIKQNIIEGKLKAIYSDLIRFFVDTKGGTLGDYADTTVRYFVQTGLLSISGDKLIVKEDKILFVNRLLDEFKKSLSEISLSEFYSSTSPHLPSDDVTFLKENIYRLQQKLETMQIQLKSVKDNKMDIRNINDPNRLRKLQSDIEGRIKKLKEQIFYLKQSDNSMIKEIIDYYDKIADRSLFGGDAYLPAWLEWTTWRVFLAIDNLSNDVSNTRNFEIDEELNPIHHAKSGEPDMVFEYPDFVIVCEVTLRVKDNQWSEDEPVPRHVMKIMKKYTDKKVYGLFVAPSIDPNTILEFNKSEKLIEGKVRKVEIVSITIDQVKSILDKFAVRRFGVNDLKTFIEESTQIKNTVSDPIEWQKIFNEKLKAWVSK